MSLNSWNSDLFPQNIALKTSEESSTTWKIITLAMLYLNPLNNSMYFGLFLISIMIPIILTYFFLVVNLEFMSLIWHCSNSKLLKLLLKYGELKPFFCSGVAITFLMVLNAKLNTCTCDKYNQIK